MNKRSIVFLMAAAAAVGLAGCGSAGDSTNSSGNAMANGNSNIIVNIPPDQVPPEFSNKPINADQNSIPGFNTNTQMRKVPDDVSPAPGIPSANEIKKNMNKNVKAPGIPSEEELRKKQAANEPGAKTASNVATGSRETKAAEGARPSSKP
jgi:hypothetical protein